MILNIATSLGRDYKVSRETWKRFDVKIDGSCYEFYEGVSIYSVGKIKHRVCLPYYIEFNIKCKKEKK